jgi:ATP-dependent Lon protease
MITEDRYNIFEPEEFFSDWEELEIYQVQAREPVPIQLYDEESVSQFKKGCKDSLKTILGILTRENHRLLQVLPPCWSLIINDFEQRFPNFAEVAEILRDYFTLSERKGHAVSFPPLLLTGPAGVGKTEAARWLSGQLKLEYTLIDMATAQSGSQLAGSERHWANSRPGKIFEKLAKGKFANSVVMLDEIDKTSCDQALGALYTLLEPKSAERFTDLCIADFSVDASFINWIATANNRSNIPAPILSRFEEVQIEKPDNFQSVQIASTIYRELIKEFDMVSSFDPLLSQDVLDVLALFPPRAMKMSLRRGLARAVRHQRSRILIEDIGSSKINKSTGIGFLASFV